MRRSKHLPGWMRLARVYAHRLERRIAPTESQRLFALTILIGVACGFVAVAFHMAIRLVSELTIDRAMAMPDRGWVPWTILTPAIGGLVCGILLQRVVPNARGSGIPQVKVAYAKRGGRVRLRDAIGKFVVGTLQIGTGSSLGREGPTVQICAGVASALARATRVSPQTARKLLPVGAAAGVAAAFNAPIAAVTFAIEEVVGTLDQTLLSGVIVAAAFAAVIERSVLGQNPVFTVPPGYELHDASSLALYAVLGVAAAVASLIFTGSLLGVRMWFRKHVHAIPAWTQPAVGGLATGLLATIALATVHSKGVTGGGYVVLGEALAGSLPVRVLLVLCVLKLGATVLAYGSGGAGGIFAPSLFIGGTLGGAVGSLDMLIFHHPPATMGAFALVGMGAVFAGTVRAPITSVLIIIEMTSGYALILPLMIANMIAYALARHYQPTSIYDALLEQDGIRLQGRVVLEGLEGHALAGLVEHARDVVTVSPDLGARELVRVVRDAGSQQVFPVVDPATRQVVGMITTEEVDVVVEEPGLESFVTAADMMRPAVVLRVDDDLRTAFEVMLAQEMPQLAVVDSSGKVIGVIEESAIARAYVRRRVRANEPVGPTKGRDA